MLQPLFWSQVEYKIVLFYLFENFYNKSVTCVDHHLPKRKVGKKRLKLKTKLWITEQIIKLMTYRDNLLRKLNENFTVSDKYLYNKFRNRAVSEQRKSKKKYFHAFSQRYQSNIKMLWSGIRFILNIKNKSKLSLICQLKYNGTCVNDLQKIGNTFYNYFVNVGSNIDKIIPRTKKVPLDYLVSRTPNSIFLDPVTPREIEIIINSLNPNKSTGPYSIPTFLLKLLSTHISMSLSKIAKHSFVTGVFPGKLKFGKVNPLHKKGPEIIPLSIAQYLFFLFSQRSLKS